MSWKVGDILHEMVSNGDSWGGGLIYGIVIKAGPKRISVLWEPNLHSGILRRHHPEYHPQSARFQIDGSTDADHFAAITTRLTTAAREHGYLLDSKEIP